MRKPISYACEKILQRAHEIAKMMNHEAAGSEHLLIAICEDKTLPMTQYLFQHEVDEKRLIEDCKVLFEREEKFEEEIKETYVLLEIIKNAQLLCRNQVMVKHLCKSLLITSHSVALELLYKYQIDLDELLEEIDEVNLDEFDCCLNLNLANRNPNVTGREKELQWIINGLCRKEKANILLIGEAGVGKSALIEKLAERIETRNCPEKLYHHTIYELSLNQLVAGTKYRGEFEDKLQKIIQAVEKNPRSILFIDEMHQMLGAGRADGSLDTAGILKPMLARGTLKCIGATTKQEYHQFIEKDRALERRFQVIRILEPDIGTVKQMLRNKLGEYEQFHHVSIPVSLLNDIIEKSQFYMPTRYFPDKAFDLLDCACVIARQKQLKKVTTLQIEEAIESVAFIPVHLQVNEIRKQFKEMEDVKVVNEMLENLLEKLDKETRCWYLHDPKGQSKPFYALFSQAVFHQEIIYLDALNLESVFDYVLDQIQLNPFSMLVIQHYHDASYTVQTKLSEGIRQGYWIHQMKKISLKHVLVCILDEREFNKQYLGKQKSEVSQLDFCTHSFDFSLSYASN